ncbi:MAG: hypothetical protein PHQ52_03810 [Candidatus Omnitrophica bacterium]|nr:hypothetical protein [Candidatus Omnitrophota bacterium]
MRKKYYSPNIKRVNLNPDQAVLNVCAVAGFYMSSGGLACVTGSFIYGGARQCNLSVRGDVNGTVGAWRAASSPS